MSKPFVIDGVCHPYNFSPENQRGRFGKMFTDTMYSYFPHINPPDIVFSRERWERDWSGKEFIETMLLESATDMVCVHSLPIFDAYFDGLSRMEKCAALKRDHPDRVLWYGSVNLAWPGDHAAEVQHQIDLGCDGIKFYPAMYEDGRTRFWRMDDEDKAFPIFEQVRAAGLKNVAVHKALPLGPVSTESMRVDDISNAANVFPDLNFQIVHAGFMFVDETKFLIGNHPNVYATMEASTLFCVINPAKLQEVMTEFLIYGGPEKLIYASAAVNPHPKIVLDAFAEFQMPASGPVQLNDAMRGMFLGGNLARLHDIDIADRQQTLAKDSFSAYVSANGYRSPWSAVHGVPA